jgi:hypothetical protein
MKLPTELLLLLSIAHLTSSSPLQRRSGSFSSVRGLTTLTTDYSNPDAVTRPDKFFHESTFDPHYDGRFAEQELPHHTRAFHLQLLLKSYTETMNRIGINTWMMHGCLLGWWWNGRIMPWDSDVDVMVDERSIVELGSWWNMTVHHFTAKDLLLLDKEASTRIEESEDEGTRLAKRMLEEEVVREGKKYLLEVNPNYINTSTKDEYNVIDARWIDTSTGLYIDITTVHVAPIPSQPPPSNSDDGDDIELYTKDQHAYFSSQIFPLRESTFESVPVKIPYAYEQLLLEEYGPYALTDTYFNGYGFDPEKQEWAVADPTPQQTLILEERNRKKVAGQRSWRVQGKKARPRKKPRPTGLHVYDTVEPGKSAHDGVEGEVYQLRPGWAGDVHVVPGSGND